VFIDAPPDILRAAQSARNPHQSCVFKIGRYNVFRIPSSGGNGNWETYFRTRRVRGLLVFAHQGLPLKRKRTTDPKCRKRASGLVLKQTRGQDIHIHARTRRILAVWCCETKHALFPAIQLGLFARLEIIKKNLTKPLQVLSHLIIIITEKD